MTGLQYAVTPLRILLALVFAALVVDQLVVVPGVIDDLVVDEPDLASLRVPLLVSSIAGLACVQVVILGIATLLSMVSGDRIFSGRALRWVDAITWTIFAGCAFLLVSFACLASVQGLTGMALVLLHVVLVGLGLGLLMVVMRALLRQATTLRTEMEAVI